MKRLLLLSITLMSSGILRASNAFPEYENSSVHFAVPANTRGCMKDIAHLVGTNYVYQLNGQVFSDNQGHIQTIAEGFDGKTDESTPWKTLTELLSFYQKGGSKEEMMALYDDASINFINTVYGDKVEASFRSQCRSITNMSVMLGLEYSSYYLAFVKMGYSDGHHNVLPFVFTKNNGRYKLSAPSFKKMSPMLLNVGLYLNMELANNNR